jgi:cysteine-rich repeat protein
MKRLNASGLALAILLAGCSTYDGPVGTARATITQVPSGVACVQIIAAGGRTVTFNADVMPGSSSQLMLDNLPVGNVTFTGFAFANSCATSAGTKPSWASVPTLATILPGQITDVSLKLDQVGAANVGVDFNTDGGTTPALCGNGVRESGEQCDDGNAVNLDGCDSHCLFEQEQRVNSLQMQFTTDTFCTANALGTAIVGQAQSNVQSSYASGVSGGSLNMGFKFIGLSDLSGSSSPMLQLGNLSGMPATPPMGVTYNGNSDLDWWYASDASLLDVARNPQQTLGGSIAAGVLTAGPGSLRLPLGIGNNGPVNVSGLRLRGNVGGVSVPGASASGVTPGHVAGEHLDPMLSSFASITNGQLCGNMSARSLSILQTPPGLICSNPIGTSLLDLVVAGCTVVFQQVRPTPIADQVDPAAPILGTGAPYRFNADGSGHVIGCSDQSGMPVELNACLGAAAYSASFRFTTDRVIFK